MTLPLFDSMNLHASLMKSIQSLHFKTPTPIQAAAIPVILSGKDVLASAQTGTGKTLAYSIPLLMNLLENPHANALILVPTRELAMQVKESLRQLISYDLRIPMAVLIGGEPMPKQYSQLRQNPRIVVGTPGRVNDHLKRRTLILKNTSFVVIDEADRMLDMGFSIQLDAIAEYLPEPRQTVMFSATMAGSIIKLSNNYMNDPQRISVDNTAQAAPNIRQEIVHTSSREKLDQLMVELQARQGSVIIFVKTKRDADSLADKLCEHKHEADAIHGDLRQRQRDRVIADFRNSRSRILVATDIAARGLDIPHIMHVINYDLPQCPEDYIHRIGRTARAGMAGNSLCFITSADRAKWNAIQRLMNPEKAVNSPRGSRDNRSDFRPENRRSNAGSKFRRSDDSRGESRGDRPQRTDAPKREYRPAEERRSFGDKPARPSSDFSKPRFGEKKSFGDKPRSSEFGAPRFGEKKSFGDKPARPSSDFSKPRFGEKKSFGDKPRSSEFGASRFGEKKSFGDKPRSSEFGASRFGEKKSFGDKPARSSEFGASRFGEKKSFGDKPARSSEFGAPRFGDKKPFGDKRKKTSSFSEGNDRRPPFDPAAKRKPAMSGQNKNRPFDDSDKPRKKTR